MIYSKAVLMGSLQLFQKYFNIERVKLTLTIRAGIKQELNRN